MPNAPQNSAAQTLISGDAAALARRYGHALYELAEEQKQLDEVAADLRALRTLMQDSADFRAIASNPRLNRKKLVEAAQNIATAANFNKLTTNFLGLAAKQRRLNILAAIIEAYLAKLGKARGEVAAEVRSARPLSTAQQDTIAARLREMVGGKVQLNLREDASLIGGFAVKIGSKLIDASVRTKLQRLERQLKSGGASAADKAA